MNFKIPAWCNMRFYCLLSKRDTRRKRRQRVQNAFFVGDVKQSIYRFRGGAKELFDYAKKSLHLDVDALDTNYRSTGQIVHFCQ